MNKIKNFKENGAKCCYTCKHCFLISNIYNCFIGESRSKINFDIMYGILGFTVTSGSICDSYERREKYDL